MPPGHDVLTSADARGANLAVPDHEVLAFPVAQSRIVLTLNRKHFVRLHREHPAHHGIVTCTFDPDFERQAGRIHKAPQAEANGGQADAGESNGLSGRTRYSYVPGRMQRCEDFMVLGEDVRASGWYNSITIAASPVLPAFAPVV